MAKANSQKNGFWSPELFCYFVAGGIAGATSRTVVSPLERLKIIQQVQPRGSDGQYTGVWRSLVRMWKEEGFAGFMRGNGINCLRNSALQCRAVHDFFTRNRSKDLDTPTRLISGALAGITSVCSTYPLDLVRSRLSIATASISLQTQTPSKTADAGASTAKTRYTKADLTVLGMTLKVMREEGGVRGLYRGLLATAMGVAPYVGINFAAYEALRGIITPPGHSSVPKKLLCGAVAGSISQTLTFPFDVLRRKMQVVGMSEGGMGYRYNGAIDALWTIVRTEGLRGLYRGLWPNLLKVAPSIATSFFTYEMLPLSPFPTRKVPAGQEYLMAQNKQSLSTFSARPSSSFPESYLSSQVPHATPPSRSGIPLADHLPSTPPTTLNNTLGVPASTHHPPSSSTPSMGQVVSRPQGVSTLSSPSSAPSSLGSPALNASRFKRAFTSRRKKSDSPTPPSPRIDKGKLPQFDESSRGSPTTSPRQSGAKQLTLQFAQHVFNKKAPPASPVTSGLTLPPPPPPPKHAQQPSVSSLRPAPINTNVDKRISVMSTSSPIAPALDYIRKSDELTEQVASKETERKDHERSESKDIRRKSDSTLSLHTIRPSLGSRPSRPVSVADSMHSTHTIVPINKRLSALITDAEFAMAEEEDGSIDDDKSRACSLTSPASSSRSKRRSQSLNLGPPLSLMVSGPATANTTMSLETITVTLPRSTSEGCGLERFMAGEISTATFSPLPAETGDAVTRHASVKSLSHASDLATSRIERTLPDLPDTPQRIPSSPQAHSPYPSFRQTAISMTSGFAPAAGLAKRAVERMGRVWGSKGSISGSLASPLGEASTRAGPPSRASSSHSESAHYGYGKKVRHNPHTPSVSSVASSVSDHSGPQLGTRIRDPIQVSHSGDAVGGMVFGRELKTCVEETAIDSVLSAFREQNVIHEEQEDSDISEPVQWSQPSAPLERRHVPALIVRCAQHILVWGVEEQGLFRVSGRSSHVTKLRAEFDTGADFDIVQSSPGDLDPHAVASVFKAYLRELPESILTDELMPYFDAAIASERLTNNAQDLPPLNDILGLRKPPSLSTLGMPNFSRTHPPSESLRKALSSLISRLPQENRDLLFTVTEVINHTARRSSETKMPLSNLLLVLCPSLSMNPSLLQALCESQGIWDGARPGEEDLNLDPVTGENSPISDGVSEVDKEVVVGGAGRTAPQPRPSNEGDRFVRPLPSLPTALVSTSNGSPSSSTCESRSGVPISGRAGNSHSPGPLDPETLSSSLSTTDDDSSISHLSQGCRPVTPTSLNFKLTNPYSPPSLSCSTDSLSAPSLSSGSPMHMVKPLTLVDECSPSNSPHSPDVAEPIPLPIPTLRPTQSPSEAQFQFPGPRDIIAHNPIMHRKSTPSISFSSISAEGRPASIASRAKRLKKPSLHLLFSKHSSSPILPSTQQSPVVAKVQDGPLRSSSTPDSSPDSMVTAPQSSRFSYPPVLNTAIDESSISLALGIEEEESRTASVGHGTEHGMLDPQESMARGTPFSRNREPSKGTQFRHLDVTLPEEEQFNWTKSVLMAAGESGW
ncbi:hypothetical protein JVU11DRAFT_2536 [Chiua virens]|nr:hypothetical protein JVU11DRAFT_2536 [Chiua virens]